MKDNFTLINPTEALELFSHCRCYNMKRIKDLATAYIKQKNLKNDSSVWQFLIFLSFIYETGRIQGIREERMRRK